MELSKGPVLQDKVSMGLRLSDGTQTALVKQSLSPEFGISSARTKVMSLNASGRNFIVSSNGKVDANGRSDDVDESSSGYSSRESQYGENRGARSKSQKVPPKVVYLSKEVEKPSALINGNSKDNSCVINIQQSDGEIVASKGDSSAVLNGDIQPTATIFSLSHGIKTLEEINETDVNRKIKICSHSFNTCSCTEELVAFADSKKFSRQPRIDLQDDIPDHLPPDKSGGNGQTLVLDNRANAKTFYENGKEFREVATQLDFTDHELSKECSSLKILNSELEGKLKSCNDVFELAIKRMEKQLKNAVAEIAELKSQLTSTKIEGVMSSPCIRCGYCSVGGVTGSRRCSSKSSHDTTDSCNARKDGSTDGTNDQIKQHTTPISQQSKLLNCIFRGGNPDKIKTSLLERNKSLKDEIQSLKDMKRISTNSTKKIIHQESPELTISHDFVTSNGTATEPDIACKANEKVTIEDVRWKQQPIRVARRHKKSTASHPQFTSAAFRTIHVAKWGPQI